MKFLQKYNSQIIGIVLIFGILYFGTYFGLRAIHQPPKFVIVGKSATVQSGSFRGKQVNDASISVPFGMDGFLNGIYKPVNDLCRSKTGFGLYFAR